MFPDQEPRTTRRFTGNVTPIHRPVPLERFRPLLQACLARLVDTGTLSSKDRITCEEIMGWREPAVPEPLAEVFELTPLYDQARDTAPAGPEAAVIPLHAKHSA